MTADPRFSANERKEALIAAHLASAAQTELLRFAQFGAAFPAHPYLDADPAAKLAEALIKTLEIEIAGSQGAGFAMFREKAALLMMNLRSFLVLNYGE